MHSYIYRYVHIFSKDLICFIFILQFHVRLYVKLSVGGCLFIYIFICLSVCTYISLSVRLSVRLSVWVFCCLLISLFHLILQHCNSYSSTWGNTKFIHIYRYVILYICLRTYVNVFALLHSCIVSLSPIIPHTQKLLCYSCETPFIFILFNMCCASFQVHLYIYFPFSFFCCFFLFFFGWNCCYCCCSPYI